MIYSSVPFIFFALFIMLAFGFLPQTKRKSWLLFSSILWLCSWKITWALVFFGITSINFFLLKFYQKKRPAYFFQFAIFLNLIFFAVLKLAPLLFEKFRTPYGSSFFIFMLIGFLIDLWRNEKNFELPPIQDFLLFPIFFPELVGGPIMRGKDFFHQLKNNMTFDYQNFIDGMLIFAVGFSKFIFLSKSLGLINLAFQNGSIRLSGYYLIFLGLTGTLQAYVDFSSYCDMGRGIARCFGFTFPINFTPFYFAKNPNDFWQRWNITLGTWIRDYISFPLMLNYGRKLNQSFMLFISFLLVGLWHGISINWILFGLFNGLIIVSFNNLSKKFRSPLIGYIFVIFIFIGNGILQRVNALKIISFTLKSSTLLVWPSETPLIWGKHINFYFILSLLLLFSYDWILEKWGSDWPLRLKPQIKIFLLVALSILFLTTLNRGLLQEEVTLPPVYFRI